MHAIPKSICYACYSKTSFYANSGKPALRGNHTGHKNWHLKTGDPEYIFINTVC